MGHEQFLLMVPAWPPETQYLVQSAFDAKNLERFRPPLPGESAAIPAIRREEQARVIHWDGPRSTSCVPVVFPLFQPVSLAANMQDAQGLLGLHFAGYDRIIEQRMRLPSTEVKALMTSSAAA